VAKLSGVTGVGAPYRLEVEDEEEKGASWQGDFTTVGWVEYPLSLIIYHHFIVCILACPTK
jgi:hypothetical protein